MTTKHVPEAAKMFDARLISIFERRTAVEEELMRMAAGKRPMPDAEKLRAMARALGDPNSAEAYAIRIAKGWPKPKVTKK